MGKPTGFLEYERKTSKAEAPKERIKHFNEFHTHLSMEEQSKQGARCMDCGVPFCQAGMTIADMTSGCPLHNLPDGSFDSHSQRLSYTPPYLHKSDN